VGAPIYNAGAPLGCYRIYEGASYKLLFLLEDACPAVKMALEWSGLLYRLLWPTVTRIGPYRFFFFGNEEFKPAHVHVQRERWLAKFSLRPVALASSYGFAALELRRIQRLVEEHRDQFEEARRSS